MTSNTNIAITQIVKAMQSDAEDIMNMLDTASGDIGEGRRNSAIGAVAGLDVPLERLAALLSAIRAIHRMQPL